jgi:hypothetical protein
MAFRAGWYQFRFEPESRRRWCRWFKSPTHFTGECYIEPDGRQILTWTDPAGLNGPGKPMTWSADLKYLPTATNGDWWDNPKGQQANPSQPGNFNRADREPTPRELARRAASVDPSSTSGLNCCRDIEVGVFFDGTNNNMDRDKSAAVPSHSNVVTLFEAHKNDREMTFGFYIPGVGTKFAQIGEMAESSSGKAFAAGGEARIHFALLQVYNAVCLSVTNAPLLNDEEMTKYATSVWSGLATFWRLGDYKLKSIFKQLDAKLSEQLKNRKPAITRVTVSIFGFSRGAAKARVFSKWLQIASQGQIAGAALNIRFLGIFDTVASVGIADSAPLADGLMDWADGNLGISGVANTVHYVAAHEIRKAFPLSSAGAGGNFGSGCKEYVYPGAHSDVGGGYSPGDQGKSVNGRKSLLSQIPLNDMYNEALNAGVQLRVKQEMPGDIRADFDIAPEVDAAFRAYCDWTSDVERAPVTAAEGGTGGRMARHTHLYWRWRALNSPTSTFAGLKSYSRANAQDKQDLWDSELDWRRDVAEAERATQSTVGWTLRVSPIPAVVPVVRPPKANAAQKAAIAEIRGHAAVPAAAHAFFDAYVHDSHASFYMLGPTSQFEKEEWIKSITNKKKLYDMYLTSMNDALKRGDHETAGSLSLSVTLHSLNRFEQRVIDAQGQSGGGFPVMSDQDVADLRATTGLFTGTVVGFITDTRRESGGHLRYRKVFEHA